MRLIVFATRYDAVTEQTFRIAQRLVERTELLSATVESLLESDAVASRVQDCLCETCSVLALYSHGDEEGQILGQDRVPCWVEKSAPDLAGAFVFAHACRGFGWLVRQADLLRSSAIWGYAIDLLQPPVAPDRFWELYREIHSTVPARLLGGADAEVLRVEFYEFCTIVFDELVQCGAGLAELVAVTQSRDALQLFETGQSKGLEL
jgi:hypothetical protein